MATLLVVGDPITPDRAMRRCRWCGEEIHLDAKTCRLCGQDMGSPDEAETASWPTGSWVVAPWSAASGRHVVVRSSTDTLPFPPDRREHMSGILREGAEVELSVVWVEGSWITSLDRHIWTRVDPVDGFVWATCRVHPSLLALSFDHRLVALLRRPDDEGSGPLEGAAPSKR